MAHKARVNHIGQPMYFVLRNQCAFWSRNNYTFYRTSCNNVVYEGRVFYPGTDVNADLPQRGVNLAPHDPRNYNLKKHMVRLALYELTKLIAPNNVSVVRMRDYEDSMK